ncbi:MAG: hypothetical protein OD918_02135 [Gammaproteobacteria bacterium]
MFLVLPNRIAVNGLAIFHDKCFAIERGVKVPVLGFNDKNTVHRQNHMVDLFGSLTSAAGVMVFLVIQKEQIIENSICGFRAHFCQQFTDNLFATFALFHIPPLALSMAGRTGRILFTRRTPTFFGPPAHHNSVPGVSSSS